MATAAAQRVAVSISSPNMLGTSSNYNNNNNGFVVQSSNSHKKNRRVDDEWKEVTRKLVIIYNIFLDFHSHIKEKT